MCIQSLLVTVPIICSTREFLELFLSWPVAIAKGLSRTNSKPEVS